MDDRVRLRLGYLAVAAAAVLWAIGGNFASTLIDRGASPVELTAARSVIALAGVGLIVGLRRGPTGSKSLTTWLREGRGAILVAFGLSLAAANFTYYSAIALLPVAVAMVIQYTAPGMVVIYKAVTAGQRPGSRVLVSLALAFAGVLMLSEIHGVSGKGGISLDPAGIAMALGSAVAFSSYILLGEKVGGGLGPQRSVFYGFGVANVFWMFVILFRGGIETLNQPGFIAGLLFLGVAATIAPFLLFLWGLGIVSASPAGIISTLEPVSGALIAYLWLEQSLSVVQVVGAGAVILGIAIVQSERPVSPEALAERAAAE